VGAEQIRAEGKEELFETAALLEALAQERDQCLGDVHAAAAIAFGEGENPSRVFVPASAGGTVLADAGFFDQGQGAFERRPESGELSQELLLQDGERIGIMFHIVCILYNIHTTSTKKVKKCYFCFVTKSGKSPPSLTHYF
jgi:hypothetical protein